MRDILGLAILQLTKQLIQINSNVLHVYIITRFTRLLLSPSSWQNFLHKKIAMAGWTFKF